MAIKVDEQALQELREALATAGDDYKRNLARLTALIEQITNGDIKGDPAVDLRNKYEAKKDALNSLAKTIDEAQEYMGIKRSDFSSMIGNLQSGMK